MKDTPLAVILRPQTLDEIIGQEHLLGKNGVIRKMVEHGNITSMLLWGKSGTGKTTIARCLAHETSANFVELNATASKTAEIRSIIKNAQNSDTETIVFVDEIHRWAKNIQDILLPHVERGDIILIGATTERPAFAVNPTLLSRMQYYEVYQLNNIDMVKITLKVSKYYRSINTNFNINKKAVVKLVALCQGDARKLISVLETAASLGWNQITSEIIDAIMPNACFYFDRNGNEHFDYAQNFQCAIQCSDADSAVYWLAKWLLSGEDPVYIARRILISASEDACSNPFAALTANNAYIAAKEIGYPECAIIMSHATITIAQSKRCRIANDAIAAAKTDVQNNYIEATHANSETHVSNAGYTKIHKRYVDDQI